MSDVWLCPDIPSAIGIRPNRHNTVQPLSVALAVAPKAKSVRFSHGILARQGLAHPSQCSTRAHHSKVVSVNSALATFFRTLEQGGNGHINLIATVFKRGLPISLPV